MPLSFQQTKSFLASQSLGVILQDQNQDIASLKTTDTVGHALKSLGERHVLSEPVIDSDGEYYGCFSVNDALKSLLHCLDDTLGKGWSESTDRLSAQDMMAVGRKLCAQKVEQLNHAGELWLLEALSESSLLDALLESFNIQSMQVHHRLFVCSPAHQQPVKTDKHITVITIAPGSEKSNASALRVTGVVSQTDVVKLLWKNKQVLGEALNFTVEQLQLDGGAVFSLPATTCTLVAFAHLARDHKSSMGITHPGSGKLIGNLSVSDLRGMAPEDFPLLLLTLAEFVAVHHGKGMGKADALAGKRLQNAADLLERDIPLLHCTPDTTLSAVLDLLVGKAVHRVYVVDEQGMPRSIITLTDVLRLVTAELTQVVSTGPMPMLQEDEEEL